MQAGISSIMIVGKGDNYFGFPDDVITGTFCFASVSAYTRHCVCVCVCERQRETERETDRQTDRQTDRDRETERAGLA